MKFFVSHTILAISLISAEESDTNCKRIVVFGDSFSDTGNLESLTGGTLPPAPPYSPGRFTNGDAWIDYFADLMEYDRPLPAYAFEKDNGGTNYAIAGASSGYALTTTWTPELTDKTITLPSQGLLAQIDKYHKDMDNCNPKKSLFVIWVGAVDLLMLDQGPKYDKVVKRIRIGIKRLMFNGAKKIIVLNLPQLDKTPAVVGEWTSLFVSNTLPSGLDKSVLMFNEELSKTLDNIGSRRKGVKIIDANIVPLFNNAAKNPKELGLSRKDIGKPTLNESKLHLDGVIDRQNEENTLWFDGVHPTTAFHELLAAEVYDLVKEKDQISKENPKV